MNLRDLIAEIGGRIPIVDPDRCVHTHVEVATCQRCVSACPVEAWVLDDEQLALDTDRCDGCGLCVPSCPETAISVPALALQDQHGKTELKIGCARSSNQRREWTLPCINVVGLNELIRLYATGLRAIELPSEDCRNCANDGFGAFSERLEAMNHVLDQRGLSTIALHDDEARDRQSVATTAPARTGGASLSRRNFLFGLAHDAAKPKAVGAPAAPGPASDILPPTRKGELAFHAPRIDPRRCNGCDACLRVCAHLVLTLSASKDAYLVNPNLCTGCKTCVDVCDQQAISVNAFQAVDQLQVPLSKGRCNACGAAFHRPSREGEPPSRCRICAKTDHHRHLHQVL